ncbi:hypothetical protein AB6805_17665 [Chitinophaga sp. RCC_12]|uniref:hypothetical protein n=1 Tax=Chitinophaga sp. RCC_12 TaxID=3239226 RepID=UPI003524C7CE
MGGRKLTTCTKGAVSRLNPLKAGNAAVQQLRYAGHHLFAAIDIVPGKNQQIVVIFSNR